MRAPETLNSIADALTADVANAQETRAMSVRALTTALGHSPDSSWLYQVCHGEHVLNAHMLDRWVQLTGGANLVSYLAELAGFDLVGRTPATAAGSLAEAGRDVAEAISTAWAALEGDAISAHELQQCHKDFVQARQSLANLERRLEAESRERHESHNHRARTLAEAEGLS